MKKFNVVKNGYDTKEIDEYIARLNDDFDQKFYEQKMRINDLKRELAKTEEQLASFKQKNSNISDALVVAVETAKQIENSSKNIYDLEIKRVRSLYDKWKSFLDELMKKYPELRAKYDTKLLLEAFSKDIDKILKQNQKSIEQKEVVASSINDSVGANTVGLRMLINKMSNANRPIMPSMQQEITQAEEPVIRNVKPSEETLAKYQLDNMIDEEQKRLYKDKIKPISKLKIDGDEDYENLVDKFLTSDDEEYSTNAYSKILLEKQKNDGFDLREAVTPTENLDEIMKSFSFYPENEEDDN